MLETIFTYAINTVLGALIGGIIVWIKFQYKKSKAIEKAVKALTHDALFRQCRYILTENERTPQTNENLEHVYEAYASLGMNGTGESMYKECKKVPLKLDC